MCPAALAGWRGISLRINEAQWNVAAVVMIKCQISIAGEAGRTVIWEPAEGQGTAEVREAKRVRSQRRKRGEAGEGRAERRGGRAGPRRPKERIPGRRSSREVLCMCDVIQSRALWGVTDLVGYRKSMSFLSRKAYTRESLRLVSGVH